MCVPICVGCVVFECTICGIKVCKDSKSMIVDRKCRYHPDITKHYSVVQTVFTTHSIIVTDNASTNVWSRTMCMYMHNVYIAWSLLAQFWNMYTEYGLNCKDSGICHHWNWIMWYVFCPLESCHSQDWRRPGMATVFHPLYILRN